MPRAASRLLAPPMQTEDFALFDRWIANWGDPLHFKKL
jgi:hypothetical protein